MSSPPPSPSHSPQPLNSPPSGAAPLTAKKPHPIPWTHQETVHLIQAYQEKWYSLKRGQLKSSQWEEVAVTVAARCGYEYNHPSKSAIQCRHKMEKLRKRYREERRNLSLGGRGPSWHYFELMDAMEHGPFPISAHPMAPTARKVVNSSFENVVRSKNAPHFNVVVDVDDDRINEDDGEDEDEEEDPGHTSRSRSINYILRKPAIVNRFAANDVGKSKIVQRFLGIEQPRHLREEVVLKKRKREGGQKAEQEDREEAEGKWSRVELRLAKEVRGFAERMMAMERRKMELAKETERWRMEMENKRLEMILDSQRKIVETITETFGSSELLNNEGEEF